jgi:hypothetical protein
VTKAEMRQFARIYYREFRRDYPDVYADDGAWCAWTRMLIASEEAWPAMPELPRSVKPKALRVLLDRGLVTVSGSTFVLKGWMDERTKRAESGRTGAAMRWDSDGNANAPAMAMQERDRERSREAERGSKPVAARDPERLVKPLRETA